MHQSSWASEAKVGLVVGVGSRVAVGVSLSGTRVWVMAGVPLSWSVPVRVDVGAGPGDDVVVKLWPGASVARVADRTS